MGASEPALNFLDLCSSLHTAAKLLPTPSQTAYDHRVAANDDHRLYHIKILTVSDDWTILLSMWWLVELCPPSYRSRKIAFEWHNPRSSILHHFAAKNC